LGKLRKNDDKMDSICQLL
jgi:hypothetical protein